MHCFLNGLLLLTEIGRAGTLREKQCVLWKEGLQVWKLGMKHELVLGKRERLKLLLMMQVVWKLVGVIARGLDM